MNRQEKWDIRFLDLAQTVASWSKDPSTQVGAVITRDVNRIVSVGYNGFDEDDPDLPEHYEDRSIKYPKILHAERNAIKWAEYNGKYRLFGCTIYTVPFPPCDSNHAGAGCTDLILSRGIARVVSLKPTEAQMERWSESFERSKKKLRESGVELTLYEKIDE